MIDELPELPPTLIVRERDSEMSPNMTRANRPVQASVDRSFRGDQSARKRDPAESATIIPTYTRRGVFCIRESPPRLASLPPYNASEKQSSEKIKQRAKHKLHLLS